MSDTFLDWWLQARLEIDALRHRVAYLEEAWLRAEADADWWYLEARNPELAKRRRQELTRTRNTPPAHVDTEPVPLYPGYVAHRGSVGTAAPDVAA